jgi:hypothetical protein
MEQVLLEKVTAAQLVKKFSAFHDNKCSLPNGFMSQTDPVNILTPPFLRCILKTWWGARAHTPTCTHTHAYIYNVLHVQFTLTPG